MYICYRTAICILSENSDIKEYKTEVIRYYSTNLMAPEVSFLEALLKGIAPDGVLYMPKLKPVQTDV